MKTNKKYILPNLHSGAWSAEGSASEDINIAQTLC